VISTYATVARNLSSPRGPTRLVLQYYCNTVMGLQPTQKWPSPLSSSGRFLWDVTNYRRVPRDLGMNSLLGTSVPLDFPRVISPDLIPQCFTQGACIQILVLTAVEDAVIGTCTSLLYLQSQRANKLFCFVCCGRQLVIPRKHIFNMFQ